MPDNTSNTSNFGLTDIINAALAIWGAGSGSGSTPNFYTRPLTAGEQTEQTAKQNLFNFAGAYTDQFLRGLNNINPSWAPTSPLLGPNGGGGFMGGIKVPQIDFSKMPARPSTTGGGTTTPTTTPPPTSAPTNTTDPSQNIPGPGGPDPFAGWPDPSPNAHNVTLDDLRKYGPDAWRVAQQLAGAGIPLASIISLVTSRFGGDQTLPVQDISGKVDVVPQGGSKDTNYGINFPPATQGPRVVTVGGNLGDPGHAPPGFSLDDPFSWYTNMYGGGGSSDPNRWKYKP